MESEYTNVQIVARHLPEPGGGPFQSIQDAIAMGYDTVTPVTGIVQIGALIDGAFIPILSEKASLVHDAVELAKASAADSEPPTPATPDEQVATGPRAGVAPENQSEETVTAPPPGQPSG